MVRIRKASISGLICVLLALVSACQRAEPEGEAATGLGAQSAHAAVVLDGDGQVRTILIAGIRGPDADQFPEAAQQARQALDQRLSSSIWQMTPVGEPDRYNRVPMRLAADGPTEGVPDLASQLIADGQLMVWPRLDQRLDFDALYAHEEIARATLSGFWGTGEFAIRDSDPNRLAPYLDSAQIVEGRVIAVGESREGRIYLNFGLDWRTDLTVSANSDTRALFQDAGIDLAELEGTRVRARGWLYEENGPMIALTHPAQLQVLDAPQARAVRP